MVLSWTWKYTSLPSSPSFLLPSSFSWSLWPQEANSKHARALLNITAFTYDSNRNFYFKAVLITAVSKYVKFISASESPKLRPRYSIAASMRQRTEFEAVRWATCWTWKLMDLWEVGKRLKYIKKRLSQVHWIHHTENIFCLQDISFLKQKKQAENALKKKKILHFGRRQIRIKPRKEKAQPENTWSYARYKNIINNPLVTYADVTLWHLTLALSKTSQVSGSICRRKGSTQRYISMGPSDTTPHCFH